MLNIFKKKPKVGGRIQYYGIEDYWLNTLTTKQHEEVKHRWSLGLGANPDSIDKGNLKQIDLTKSRFLIIMAEGISDPIIQDTLLQWSLREQTSDVIDNHFNLMSSSDVYKKMIKSDKSYYPKQIEILKSDCELYDEFCTEYPKLSYYNKEDGIPSFASFRELAIAYERTSEFQKAIDISQLAIEKSIKDNTSFERRIDKLNKKLVN